MSKEFKAIYDFIKQGRVKTRKAFKTVLGIAGISDHEFIKHLKANPDPDVLDWLDDNPDKFDGVKLINKDWMKRNINLKKLKPRDMDRLGLQASHNSKAALLLNIINS